jgi:hypothetical protein
MKQSIVLYSSQFDTHSVLLDEFEERIADSDLHHYASELLEKGLQDEEELEQALQKAITALCAAHMPCRCHIKKVFISYGDNIRNDWLVSDLALRLIIMNADVSNPIVARLQVELLRNS